MAYIRWGEKLPSGKESRSYVIGSPDGLMNMDMNKGSLIPYCQLRDLIKTKTEVELKEHLRQKLELQAEELEVVCSRLFDEISKGEWNKQFEFEA